jgi:hypothetical protein
MLTDVQQKYLSTIARTLQIIVGALAMGVWMFAGVVLLLDIDLQDEGQPVEPFLAYLAAGAAIVAIVAWGIAPGMIASRMREAIVAGKGDQLTLKPYATDDLGDAGPLGGVYQVRAIIGAAILEGAAFFNLMAYMLEGQLINLAAAGVLVLIMLCAIPTYGRVESWVQNELTTIEQLRQMQTYDGR